MHDKSPVEFHRQLINLRKNESRLKKFVSIPRPNPEKEVLVESLRNLHGEIARLQSDVDAKSYS